MSIMPKISHFVLGASLVAFNVGCGSDESSFSILPDSDVFQQSTSNLNNKIDIVWMVDGSGTMANHQTNLANNFNAFISGFVSKGFDFNMVVASTDAWLRERNYNGGTCSPNPNPSQNPNTIYRSSADCDNTLATFGQLTHFRDGDIYGAANGTPGVRSGEYLITSAMPLQQILDTFAINVRTGTRGDGSRESGLQSLRSVLRLNEDGTPGYGGETHTALANFRRPDAFLVVIIITDEEDQSRKANNNQYANSEEYVQAFTTMLDGYTGSVAGNRRYNVNSIVLEDINNCAYGLHPQATQGDRYVAVTNAMNGILGNICNSDFSSDLDNIASNVASLSTRFQLSREPVLNSIRVNINGSNIAQSNVNGWSYVNENGFYFIQFHGSAVPAQGSEIKVDYDPVNLEI